MKQKVMLPADIWKYKFVPTPHTYPRLASVSCVRMLHDMNVLLPDQICLTAFRVTAHGLLVLKAEKDG